MGAEKKPARSLTDRKRRFFRKESSQAGGHYSAIPKSNIIGPEGGRMLVDKTVEIIDELWR